MIKHSLFAEQECEAKLDELGYTLQGLRQHMAQRQCLFAAKIARAHLMRDKDRKIAGKR